MAAPFGQKLFDSESENAVFFSFFSKSKIGGWVIGPPDLIKIVYWFDVGFSVITFFLSSDFNELDIYPR